MNEEHYGVVRDAADLYQVVRLVSVSPDGIPIYEVTETHALALQRALKLVTDFQVMHAKQ